MRKSKKGKKKPEKPMEFTFKGSEVNKPDLAYLERKRLFTSARLTYAMEQRRQWENEVKQRCTEFGIANTEYIMKKEGFSISDLASTDAVMPVWDYVRKVIKE